MITHPISRPLKYPLDLYEPLLKDPALEILYLFDGGGSSVVDHSSKGNSGISSNAIWRGDSLVLDSGNTLNVNNITLQNQHTVFIFLKPDSLGGFRFIFISENSGTRYSSIYMNNSGKAYFDIQNTAYNTAVWGGAFVVNKYTSACGVVDIPTFSGPDQVKLYIDGIYRDNGIGTLIDQDFGTNTFNIGHISGGSNFIGNIYFLAVYNRALNSSEVKSLHDFAKGLV